MYVDYDLHGNDGEGDNGKGEIMTLQDADLKYAGLTRRIIGCGMAVHSALGNGFQEVVYQRALAVEMEREGLSFSREHEMPIWYRDVQVGTRRVDFFVEEIVLVELKAISSLEECAFGTGIELSGGVWTGGGVIVEFRRAADWSSNG